MFTVGTISITGPYKLLRTLAAMVILLLFTDASCFAIKFLKLLFIARNLLLE
jgi:hypothetical protein